MDPTIDLGEGFRRSGQGAREGVASVHGAQLAWRVAGTPGRLPTVVFENGALAPYLQWTLVEPLLAAHTQVIGYDRAGIGASIRQPGAHDAQALSTQFTGLLDALDVRAPVVIVGQSYGGLIAGLHAALQPDRVRAIVQLDPTPELDDPFVERQLTAFGVVFRLSMLAARLKIRNRLFAGMWAHFPPEAARRTEERAFGSPRSLRAAADEIALRHDIRAQITRHLDARTQPRLVVSAGSAEVPSGRLFRLLYSPRKVRTVVTTMQALHQRQAARGAGGSWEEAAPYTHGGLTFDPAGAAWSAGRVLRFLETLAPPG